MARSSNYYRKARGPSQRVQADDKLAGRIRDIQERHKYRYGIQRIQAALKADGHERQPGHNQVARVMQAYGLNAVIRQKRRYFSAVDRKGLVDESLLKNELARSFQQSTPGTHIVSDVTYIKTSNGWLYVSPVMDLCTREILSCEMSMSQDLDLGIKTLNSISSKISDTCLLHTDRGFMYTHMSFRSRASEQGIRQSYSRKGNCWDNAVMEGWNGILKTEWLYHPEYKTPKGRLPTPEEVRNGVKSYIIYYNECRIQKKLGYRSPVQYREAITQ